MPAIEDAIVLLSSKEPDKNKAFGSAFIIAHDNGYSYLLTCAHVIEQINKDSAENKLKILEVEAAVEIVCCGSSNAIDIALLKVSGLLDKPVFKQFALGQSQHDIYVTGYSSFEKRHLKRPLKGKLGKPTKITAGGKEAPFWDVHIFDDELSKLDGGYSGSPVYNQNGQVLAIVSHKRSGDIGHAFCISNLLTLYPEVIQLIPALEQLKNKSELGKIKLALEQRQHELGDIYSPLIIWLEALEDPEADKEAKKFLRVLNSFLADFMSGEDVRDFFTMLLQKQQKQTVKTNAPDYQYLTKRLQNGEIVVCIGADLPAVFDSTFKPSSALPQKIVQLAELDYQDTATPTLSEVCEHAQLHQKCTRFNILSELESLLKLPENYQPDIALYELLSQLQQPFLAIAGGFDTFLEYYLKTCRHKFVSVICNVNAEMERERLIVEYVDENRTESVGNEDFSKLQLMEKGYSIIYYPRGYPNHKQDTALLAERDYFDSSELPNKRYPDYLRNKLTRSGLWFLGYQPESWETRLLAKVLQEQRGKSCDNDKAIVIQENADSFARLFWDYNRCDYYAEVGLKAFADKLKTAIEEKRSSDVK
ncbi:MAG: hypothetical protein GQ569_02350 [Methylococcaceae bacterium]|nr:hypothetical protein [Methylococcaceae bacterium]